SDRRQRPVTRLRERLLRVARLAKRDGERAALVAHDLAADEVVRLDAGGAFVDRRDARVARELRSARLLDEAQAAVNLHAEVRDLLRDLRAPALDDRDHQLGEREIAPARVGVGMMARAIER